MRIVANGVTPATRPTTDELVDAGLARVLATADRFIEFGYEELREKIEEHVPPIDDADDAAVAEIDADRLVGMIAEEILADARDRLGGAA